MSIVSRIYHGAMDGGFALPTVLISSVILFIILVSAIGASSTIRSTIDSQRYQQLAREAAESGIARARECLRSSGQVVTWTTAKPLMPNTDCNGTVTFSCTLATRDSRCGIYDSSTLRTTFTVGPGVANNGISTVTSQGSALLLRPSNSVAWKTYNESRIQVVRQLYDDVGVRASQRYWYFGNYAMLDFGVEGVGSPQTFYNSSAEVNGEGSTVVSDRQGNLLFWTNGATVWDKNNNAMPNGTGLNGFFSATQTAAALPLDVAGKKYIIVTATAGNETTQGPGELYYSVVDMSLNGGLGDVVSAKKNIKLGTGTGYASEALSAAPNALNDGYWVLTYTPNSKNIVAFQIKKDGTVTGPVVSTASTVNGDSGANIGFGTINFSTYYDRFVMSAGKYSDPSVNPSTIRLMNFNRSTGVATEQASWLSGTSHADGLGKDAGYSADFSPLEKYIYASTLYAGRVYRYDISTSPVNSATVKASEEFVGYSSPDTSNSGGGQVKRAPNGKMYVANNLINTISIINNPDNDLSTIGYQYGGFMLASGSLSRYGFPQMATSFSASTISY